MAPPPDNDDPPRRRSGVDSTLRGGRIDRLEDCPTLDEPPTTEVGFALRGEMVGGRFRLGERLSWGGMGTVYRALDVVTDREVAVKIPHLGDAQTDARFQAESAAVASVVCTSVIAFVAHGSTEEPFLAMELVRGEPLYKHLQRGPLGVTATAAVGVRIASALAAIHAGGWVHRDIKPGNIVVDEAGTAKLLDFGLSRHIDASSVTGSGQVLGTLGYMAPEQLLGGWKIDPKADVYALGVVLHECLTGKRAFNRTVADVAARRFTSSLDIGALGLPPAFEAALQSAVNPGLDDRAADGLDLLFRMIAAVDPAFHPPPLAEARAGLGHLLRMGAVHVTGDAAPSLRPACDRAAALARGFAEIVAPSYVVRLRCDPVSTNADGAHALALARTLEAEGYPLLAARLADGRARDETETKGTVVLLVDDATWCDARSAERIATLAAERALYVILSSAIESEALARPFEAVPRVSAPWGDPADVANLTPMGRWCLRAAGVFGWRFSLAAAAELVGGPEADEVPAALEELASAGLVRPDGEGRFVFTSSRALAAARRLARPSEARLGARIARRQLARTIEAEPHVRVDPTCSRLTVTGDGGPPAP